MAIDDNASYELTGYQVKDLASKVRAKADSAALASVATSGLYSDLTGRPTIPAVYNGTLTIQQDGTTLGTFSANQSTNETINITGGGGGAVTYYIADGDPNYAQTIGSGFVYTDSARTIKAEAADVYADMQSGKTVYLEYRTGPATDRRETMFTITSMTRRETQGVVDRYDYFGSMTSYMDGVNTNLPSAFGFLVQGSEPATWQFVQQYIPTVNNGTLTIQQNGTNVQTFTADSATDKTANIETIYAVDAIDTSEVTPTYSTTEQATYEKWIDGKTIYRKVYTGTWSADGNVSVTVVTDPSVDNIIATGGWFDDNTAKIAFGQRHWLSNVGSDSTSFAMVAPAGLTIRLVNGSGILTDRPYQIWVEYTK